jgi:hypothetical protein
MPDSNKECIHESRWINAGPLSDDIAYLECKKCGRSLESPTVPVAPVEVEENLPAGQYRDKFGDVRWVSTGEKPVPSTTENWHPEITDTQAFSVAMLDDYVSMEANPAQCQPTLDELNDHHTGLSGFDSRTEAQPLPASADKKYLAMAKKVDSGNQT